MIPEELARKIRYIQIHSSKTVNDVLAGEYHSLFKGQGMEFEEVRPYQPGDDVRAIDWNVTARTGEPFIKRYREERELSVIFLVDLSASGDFGSTRKLKNEVAAEICALLAFSAIKNNDKAGLVIFTGKIELFVPPAKGTSHVLRLIRDLLEFKPSQARTDIRQAIEFLGRVTTKRSVVFLVSDFLENGFDKALRAIGAKHDVVAISITDPLEVRMPDVGLVELEDAETGEWVQVDTSSPGFRARYQGLGDAHRKALRDLFRSMDIDQLEILTSRDRDHVRDVVTFFRTRERRKMR